MKYIEVVFTFKNQDNSAIEDEQMMTAARDIAASLAGEIGFESFVETEEGMNGYILDNMFHKEILDECLKDFPIEGIKTAYVNTINVSDILKYQTVVATSAAVTQMEEVYNG